jgi:hypothetical protein
MASARKPKFKAVPINVITTPKDGYICYADRWWFTDGKGHVFLAGGNVPQCNPYEHVARATAKLLGFADVVFIKYAFPGKPAY